MWLEGPEVRILNFTIYGCTGGNNDSKALQKTDDLISIAEEECRAHPEARCIINGDFNADEGTIPTLSHMTETQGWTDCGAQADIWGGIPRQFTCRAGPNTKISRIDFVLVNEALFPAIRGFQVDCSCIYKTHQPMQLRLDAGSMTQESDRYRKTTSASKLIGIQIDRAIEEREIERWRKSEHLRCICCIAIWNKPLKPDEKGLPRQEQMDIQHPCGNSSAPVLRRHLSNT